MTPIATSKLVNECRQNNPKSQELLYRYFLPSMLSVCLRYTKEKADAEDILQEGFTKVFMKIHLYTGEGSFEGWMKRIMINTALSFHRKSKSRIKTVNMEAIEHTLYDKSYNTDDDSRGLIDTLNSLPNHYRTTLNLFALEGYSHKEIASKTGISPLQSRVNVYRARTMLRQSIPMGIKNKRAKPLGHADSMDL
jgi:RNA polymerase sigma factor (sigma-70 family)